MSGRSEGRAARNRTNPSQRRGKSGSTRVCAPTLTHKLGRSKEQTRRITPPPPAPENHARGALSATYISQYAQHTVHAPTHHAAPPAHPSPRSQRSPTHRTIRAHHRVACMQQHRKTTQAGRCAQPAPQTTPHTICTHPPTTAHPCPPSQRSPTHRTIPQRTPLSSPHTAALENHAGGALCAPLRAACTAHHAQHTVHAPAHHAPPPRTHPCPRSQRSSTHRTIPPRTPLSSPHIASPKKPAGGALRAACT